MFAQSTLLTVGRALNHQGAKPKCTANNKSETNFRPQIRRSNNKISERGQSIVHAFSICVDLLLRPPSNSEATADAVAVLWRLDPNGERGDNPAVRLYQKLHSYIFVYQPIPKYTTVYFGMNGISLVQIINPCLLFFRGTAVFPLLSKQLQCYFPVNLPQTKFP